jgi:uncharacterized protein (DUF1330 family)
MINYLILVTIKDHPLFADYLKGHLPTLAQYGGSVVFRSTDNAVLLGSGSYDVLVMQEWPSEAHFLRWWDSPEYAPWAAIRDAAAGMTVIQCHNTLPAV